jgi:hypothetical protein
VKRAAAILCLLAAGCERKTPLPVTPAPSGTPSLWAWLQGYRGAPSLPATDEVQKLYGEPNERMEMEFNTSGPPDSPAAEYRRYRPEDPKFLPVVAWRYHHRGDPNRWVDVEVRKGDGSVVGWSWFENVPPGQEQGPPP